MPVFCYETRIAVLHLVSCFWRRSSGWGLGRLSFTMVYTMRHGVVSIGRRFGLCESAGWPIFWSIFCAGLNVSTGQPVQEARRLLEPSMVPVPVRRLKFLAWWREASGAHLHASDRCGRSHGSRPLFLRTHGLIIFPRPNTGLIIFLGPKEKGPLFSLEVISCCCNNSTMCSSKRKKYYTGRNSLQELLPHHVMSWRPRPDRAFVHVMLMVRFAHDTFIVSLRFTATAH